ncbi:hypothetical protein M0R45_002078 [Rubus argutus]|uniref:Uncharacterized protein n=1 Tax=Rubus argutus TaxID=59490 RepID=A0AAW1VDF6_RUBAR
MSEAVSKQGKGFPLGPVSIEWAEKDVGFGSVVGAVTIQMVEEEVMDGPQMGFVQLTQDVDYCQGHMEVLFSHVGKHSSVDIGRLLKFPSYVINMSFSFSSILQSLAVVTLGDKQMAQRIDNLVGCR